MNQRLIGKRIHITGVVQGVGFRPFVYGLALRYGLREIGRASCRERV